MLCYHVAALDLRLSCGAVVVYKFSECTLQDVIADQHEALLEKFETSYVQASKREDHGGLNGYDWLNEAMADYQKLTMKRCSPELSRKLNM